MVKIHDISAQRAKRSRATTGIALAAVIAAATIIGAASVGSLGEYSTAAVGQASATTQAGTSPAAAVAPRSAATPPAMDQGSDFDYFPSHYRNQATEPAEPIATF
jgi:hypothetical protein